MITREQLLLKRAATVARLEALDELLGDLGGTPERSPEMQDNAARAVARSARPEEKPKRVYKARKAAEPSRVPGDATGRDVLSQQRRLQVAKLLLTEPLKYQEIANTADIPRGSVYALLQHPWFEKADNGKYQLTDTGRIESMKE